MKIRFSAVAVVALTAACTSWLLQMNSVLAQGDAGKTTWDGVYTQQQAEKGKTDYAKDCASCHGSELEGGEMAPPLSGSSFTSNWNGESIGTLLERIKISMPANNPGTLDRDEIADIVAYMLAANKMPAGSKALPSNPDMAKDVKFVADKPGAGHE
jgi:quinoprotein glucose dehydrogenase